MSAPIAAALPTLHWIADRDGVDESMPTRIVPGILNSSSDRSTLRRTQPYFETYLRAIRWIGPIVPPLRIRA